MKHYFLINTAAGQHQDFTALAENINSICSSRNLDYLIYYTKAVGDATDFIKRECMSDPSLERRFYSCGGDGTFGETVNGAALFENAQVGIIPKGTGNDFVKYFGKAEQFCDIESQLDGTVVALDLLKYNDKYAANMINIGFDCEVVRQVAVIKRKPHVPDGLAYIYALIGTLVRKPGVTLRISRDGGDFSEHTLLLTTIANGQWCGGGFCSNPLASMTDGIIDLLLVNNVSRIKFLTLVGDYKKGTHITKKKFSKTLSYNKYKTIDIEFDGIHSICVDGELEEYEKLHIEVASKALRLCLPKGITVTTDMSLYKPLIPSPV